MEEERRRLVEIIRNGDTGSGEAKWDRNDIMAIVLSIRRSGVVRRLERGDDDPYGLAFKQIAEAYVELRKDDAFKPVSLPPTISIDRLVELYSEVKSTPEKINKNREYVRSLARLTYGNY